MAGSLLPQPKQLFQDANWNPLIGGKIYTYAAGTLTPKTTYQDTALTIANPNPTVPNARGETLMYGAGLYRVILKDASGTTIYDVDNIESTRSISEAVSAEFAASLALGDGSGQVGFQQEGSGAVLRSLLTKGREWKTPEDFGAKGNDAAHDDTPAFQALFASAAINGHSVMLGRKTYYLSSLTIFNCNEVTIISQGAKLRGKYTGAYPHVLRIDQTSITMNIIGTLIIDGSCNVGYVCGLFVGSGYNDLTGLVFTRCSLCVKIDRDYLVDGNRGVSEIKIQGGYSYACLRIIEALGFNTIVNFNGFVGSTGLLDDAETSDLPGGARPAAWDAADSTTIRAIGASLFFTGSHLTNVRGSALIDVQPIISASAPTTPISYGGVFVSASNIEAIRLGGATNPNNYPTPDYPKVNISITGCQGFIGGNEIWIKLHGTFNGKVRIKQCSFYSGVPRTNFLGVSDSGYAQWDVDPESFGLNIANSGLGSGFNAFSGGIFNFVGKQVLRVNSSSTVTASDGSVVPVCISPVDTGNSARFIAAYGTDGVFTVPRGGLQDVVFDMHFVLSATAAAANPGVTLNGAVYKFGPSSASSAKTATAYFPKLNEGDKIAPFIANNTGFGVSCNGSSLNQIIITASNP